MYGVKDMNKYWLVECNITKSDQKNETFCFLNVKYSFFIDFRLFLLLIKRGEYRTTEGHSE